MKPTLSPAPRSNGHAAHGETGGRQRHGGEGQLAEEFSLAWKGWTNGGGERVSTAAQFSKLAERLPASAVSAPPFVAAAAGLRTAQVASGQPAHASTNALFPTSESALMAPLAGAIERLMVRGNDQLALTVRFEQGGSLQLRLAMREGEIATQIQTDVPGLEQALRSAWGNFAQDWNGRGLKLAQPTFQPGGNPHGQPTPDQSRDHQHAGEHGPAHAFGERPTMSRAARSRGIAASGPAAGESETVIATATSRTGIRGLHTWA